ncbi:hypothetical protein SAMN05443665_1001442 [Actinomadura meyerae]|uniref:CU044_5270 family protein n=2 Tax=Actinomadura meyerae TaxID=240840 RepID=A0A239CI40_9ACTN|nr:hypothetical protein SAMN05443665_1001442 [Actinomadura meyerae]
MTSGESMKDADTIFRGLKPAALDELAGEGHARRRDTDLARAMGAAAEPAPRRALRLRRPLLLAAAATAAACAAAGAIVITDGDGGASPPGVVQQGPAGARDILLASAKAAEKTPATVGRYWYARTQTRVVHEYEQGPAARRPGSPGGRPKQPKKLPYTYVTTGEQESWTARSPRDRTRTIAGIGVKASFPTARDEAAWRRAGSPELLDEEDRTRSVNDYDEPVRYTIGSGQVSMAELRRLPADAAGLAAELRRRYAADVRAAGGRENVDPYPYYVWMVAQDLLAGPLTPGTRAALYRVLSEQEGVRSDGAVTDQLRRRGVGVSMGGPAGRIRLIIDPRTAALLAFESFVDERGEPGLSMAYKAMGWVDSLDARP